jgi:hypothetical protein
VGQNHPSEAQLIELAKADPEAIGKLAFALFERLAFLQGRLEKVEAELALLKRNSRTSSKPPSSDSGNFTNPPKPKSLRSKTGRKPGGQKGRRGDTLERVANPDHIVEHRLGEQDLCPKCQSPMDEVGEALAGEHCECRQVFELPAIPLEITEHRAGPPWPRSVAAASAAPQLPPPFPKDSPPRWSMGSEYAPPPSTRVPTNWFPTSGSRKSSPTSFMRP